MSAEEPVIGNGKSDPEDDGWLVTISVGDRDDQTAATARLHFRGSEWIGAGTSRLAPREQGMGGCGSQLAITKALSDLAGRIGKPIAPR